MSAKLSSTAPSPSIANLASKVISRLANNNNNSNSNNNNNNASTSTTSNSNQHTAVEEDEDSGENEEDDEDAGIIRCICNFNDDDGFTIQCERCFVWQHAVCVGIVQSNVPDKYLCELCSPRPVDRKRANEIQRRRTGTLERKREKSPSRRKSSVGRPRKQIGSALNGLTEQSAAPSPVSKENGVHPTSMAASGASNGYPSKGSSSLVDPLGKKNKNGSTGKQGPQYAQGSGTTPSSTVASSKQKPTMQLASRMSSATNEDEDLDMESDSQEDVQDAYQFEFSSIESNIVTSKAAQDLFRQVIAQFRQAQSRKRSLSLTAGVKLHELVASNSTASSNSSTPSIPESPDPSTSALGSQPSPLPPSPNADPSNVVSMERESLARPLMKTTVKHILPSSRAAHSPVSQYGLFAESNIGAGRFMMEFKGEVSLKSAYKSDPINQYSILATPKPFVLFHPQLNLVVDARRSGNDARFVRRSCTPNTEVKSIVVPGVQDQTVHLGLFAKVSIGKGQEITLDWDWNWDHPALQSIKAAAEKSKDGSGKKGLKEIRKAKHLVASTLLAHTDCACDNKETCVLHQMLRDSISELGVGHQESLSALNTTATTTSTSATKGSRPKKTNSESLRQRYGGQRERSEGKRSADLDTSDEELSAVENSPRRKSPKAFRLEGSSKKARRESHSHPRSVRAEQDIETDSDSDDHRRRKQTIVDRHGSPSKRASITGQEMSAREMKQALMLIKKMEDRDATGHSKQKSVDISAKDVKWSGLTSPKPRTRDRGRIMDTDQRSVSPGSKAGAAEDDDISIGDSGIDSDSNNGALRRDPFSLDQHASSSNKQFQPFQSHGKQDGEPLDQNVLSQSSAASDSDRNVSMEFSTRPLTQSGKKQPYAAASRVKRMAEYSNTQSSSKDRSGSRGVDSIQSLSRASSVEGSFVSIVGNTSEEDEEMNHKAGRKSLRDKNLPKGTLPATSLKPSVLPCKKIWKAIYLKQRALAEEEAREKAEEMRKKAEEVFDLKMEEPVPMPFKLSDITEDSEDRAPTLASQQPPQDHSTISQPSMVEGDVLNLFNEDIKPSTGSSGSIKDRQEEDDTDISSSAKALLRPPTIQQPVIIPPPATAAQEPPAAAATAPAASDRPRTPQKMSLESYHARRLASSSPALAEDQEPAGAPMVTPSTTTAEPSSTAVAAAEEIVDVEMMEANPVDSVTPAPMEAPIQVDDAIEVKVEAALAIPKVKLSLQEYQKQRQEASQRTTDTPDIEVSEEPKAEDQSDDVTKDTEMEMEVEVSIVEPIKAEAESVDKDVEMSDESKKEPSSRVAEQDQDKAVPGDYFQLKTSLPTPLIGLSSRVQGATPSSGDYFPVQPFSPLSLSAGPTPFSKLNLTSSSPPPPPRHASPADAAQGLAVESSSPGQKSPAKPSTSQRAPPSSSPKEPSGVNPDLKSPADKAGSSPPPPSQGSSGWRTPRSQRGHSPPPPASTGTSGGHRGVSIVTTADHRAMDARPVDARLASPRYYGSPSDRPERPSLGSLNSPSRERQHSLTSGGLPTSPFENGYPSSGGGHYGYNDDSSSFKRSGHLTSPTGPSIPSGPREYYKSEERVRHRSMNGEEWGYGGGIESPSSYGGYRGPRGGPPPPPRDRERDRERDHERERERDRRDRFDRRGDYFAAGPPGGSGGGSGGGGGFYGPNRGPPGPSGPGGYGRRAGDYYNNQGREDGYGPSSASNNNSNTNNNNGNNSAT